MVLRKPSNKFASLAGEEGTTLIEILIAMVIFGLVAYSIYFAYAAISDIVAKNKWRGQGIAIIEDEVEKVRNMPYADVGILGGYPAGKLLADKIVISGGANFTVHTVVRNIDDPFDGTLGGIPGDTAPADYKLVEFELSCQTCVNFLPVAMRTTVSPKSLETQTNNGSLFINVFDAYAQPVPGANVLVSNLSVTPSIIINDVTNINGILQLVDIPTSTAAYEITVTKPGYSAEQTLPLADPENPNPLKPHATVASQTLTSISFAIDRLSKINLRARTRFCEPIYEPFDVRISGAKLIGTAPDILKHDAATSTDQEGNMNLDLEWDTYAIANLSSGYDVEGSSPSLPLTVNPSSTIPLWWTMTPKNGSAVLFDVTDAESGTLINDAKIHIESPVDREIFSNQSSIAETTWINGGYDSQSGGVNADTPGSLTLAYGPEGYSTTTQWLTSQTLDFGTSTAKFYRLGWSSSEPSGASVKFQIAGNNDNATWSFAGPDGTESTSYAAPSDLPAELENKRYIRYKVFLETGDSANTPILNDVSIGFSSPCLAGGQAYINGLDTGIYSFSIEKQGYQTLTDSISLGNGWNEYKAKLYVQ